MRPGGVRDDLCASRRRGAGIRGSNHPRGVLVGERDGSSADGRTRRAAAHAASDELKAFADLVKKDFLHSGRQELPLCNQLAGILGSVISQLIWDMGVAFVVSRGAWRHVSRLGMPLIRIPTLDHFIS
jgi:hypothetical protein